MIGLDRDWMVRRIVDFISPFYKPLGETFAAPDESPPPSPEPPKQKPQQPPPNQAQKQSEAPPAPPAPEPVAPKTVQQAPPAARPAPPAPPAGAKGEAPKEAEPESNINAPDTADINSVGLLSALKGTDAGGDTGDLSTSALSEAPATEGAYNANGVPITQSSNVGLLGIKTKLTKVDLSKAATGIKGSDAILSRSSGPISRRKGISTASAKNFGTRASFARGSKRMDVQGGLTKSQVKKYVVSAQNKIKACYEAALIAKPSLRGKVVYRWVISSTGKVETAKLVKSEIRQSQFENCTLKVIEKINFPSSARPTEVVYPFIFK